MIEFALSKLNMLIFVTAIAGIVVFFMSTVNSDMKMKQSSELAYKIGKEIKSGVESNSYCSVKIIDIPKKIYTNSANSSAFSINYKLNISVLEYTNVSDNKKKIILTILDKKTKKTKIYAAYDMDYFGEVIFYESNYEGGKYGFDKKTDSITFDPLKINSIDSKILFVKKIENGNPVILIIPCLKKNGRYQCSDFLETPTKNDNLTLKDRFTCLTAVNDLFVRENVGN